MTMCICWKAYRWIGVVVPLLFAPVQSYALPACSEWIDEVRGV